MEDLSSVSEKGKSGKCPECRGSYWIHRESFILRCYAVTGKRYCHKCGEELNHSTFCPACSTLYPDYCAVHSKRPAPRSFAKKNFSLNLALPASAKKSPTTSGDEGHPLLSGNVKKSRHHPLVKIGAIFSFLAVLAVVAFLYLQNRAENQFTHNFVAVLYGIKSGTDQCMKLSARLASGTPLNSKELSLLKSVHAENTSALQALVPPPKKFSEAHSRLLPLAATYDKLNNLCTSSGPTPTVTAAAEALQTQFNTQAKALRSVLPPKLSAEIKEKSTRLTNLQFMTQ